MAIARSAHTAPAPSLLSRAKQVLSGVDRVLPEVDALYRDLHAHPELSGQEVRTSEAVARRLEAAGFEVTRAVGGHGVVGVLRNGEGPTVALRGDMDALPVLEQTGLPYASRVVAKRPDGTEVPVMHACGHDVHTACLVGSAELLADRRGLWRGTLLVYAQPAEETIRGARAMLADGLYTRFPRPDVVLGQHVAAPGAGVLFHRAGPIMSASSSLRLRVFGKGAHGSQPEVSVDPIVIAASIVVRLQSLVAREVSPVDSAVVTVGSFHAGTRPNIIPGEAVLELTVRAVEDRVMRHLLAGIERIARAECEAGRSPQPPQLEMVQSTTALVNTEEVVARVQALHRALFAGDVEALPFAASGSEDFGLYGQPEAGPYEGPAVPVGFWILGANPRADWEKSSGQALVERMRALPGPHMPSFKPDREPTLHRGVEALASASLEFLGAPAEGGA